MTSDPLDVAIIGIACRYPGAPNPLQLWENILARRVQFRRLPDERLPLADYYDADPKAPDKTYARRAAVIDGFNFDWAANRVPKATFESTDTTHWLALEVAQQVIRDAGYEPDTVPTERTGVILGNSLTGEVSRSFALRLRWPFVRRMLVHASKKKQLPRTAIAELEREMEATYKSVFPPVTEDWLAGGLSNTIAGRICNTMDFHGGGYTVDGACSSSALAVATAAGALHRKELDFALAGGIDISLDPFELVGFSKTSALTTTNMRVFDRRGDGFIPGEGCGLVALKRLEDARNDGDYVYAVLRGAGISSDGKGGLTAPDAKGQSRALMRAYDQAGLDPHALDFIEGHSTGTAVGDREELQGIALTLNRDAEAPPRGVGITSIKSIIGHTKAAAGVAGLLKAVMAVNRRVLPPTAGCDEFHPLFSTAAKGLFPMVRGNLEDRDKTLRAGVSGFGFGGINCHLTLESGDEPSDKLAPALDERALLASSEDSELFVLAEDSVGALIPSIHRAIERADGCSVAELTDFSAELCAAVDPGCGTRAAVIAREPEQLVRRFKRLLKILNNDPPSSGDFVVNPRLRTWIGRDCTAPRVGYLFPGQGSQKLNMARAMVERHDWARTLVEQADERLAAGGLPTVADRIYHYVERAADRQEVLDWKAGLAATEVAQPAICLASLLWIRQLARLGIEPVAVGGHSLGELTAFHAAGAFDELELIRLAGVRGKAMGAGADRPGTMASLSCDAAQARGILARVDGYVVIAHLNSPRQTVISGEAAAVVQAVGVAEAEGVMAVQLPVSNAFHSKLVGRAESILRHEAGFPGVLPAPRTTLLSSLDGKEVPEGRPLPDHFADQLLAPGNFIALAQQLAVRCDLLLEVGPGRVLSGLARDVLGDEVCLPVEPRPGETESVQAVLATLFVRGTDIRWENLHEQRLTRPFEPATDKLFIRNPCENPLDEVVSSVDDEDSTSASLDALLPGLQDIPTKERQDYFEDRADFISDVIRADMNSRGIKAAPRIAPALTALATSSMSLSMTRDDLPAPPDKTGEFVAFTGNQGDTPAVDLALIQLVADHTDYPPDSIGLEMRLLDDLNLDSIKAGEIIAAAGKACGVGGLVDPAPLLNATLGTIATVFQAVAGNRGDPAVLGPAAAAAPSSSGPAQLAQLSSIADPVPQGPTWVRDFGVELVEESLGNAQVTGGEEADPWVQANVLIFVDDVDDPIAREVGDEFRSQGARVLRSTFERAHRDRLWEIDEVTHALVFLPREMDHSDPTNALGAVIERLTCVTRIQPSRSASQPETTVGFVQFSDGCRGVASFAASLHHERTDLRVRAIELPASIKPETAALRIRDELVTPAAYESVIYDEAQRRRVPRMRLLLPASYEPRDLGWTSDDVVLVTGGAKGITAECALALAADSLVQLALVGTSEPPQAASSMEDTDIARTLSRARAEGLTARYYRCDVTDAGAVRQLVAEIRASQGPIRGVVHGAGLNHPRPLADVELDDVLPEISPKLMGAYNLCAALHDDPPSLFVGLTSIIGVTGMPGNGWYAFANEQLDHLLRTFGEQHAGCQTQAIAYSIWDEVGMGARMGSVNQLARMGISAIPPEDGVEHFVRLVGHDPGPAQVVVTARLAGLDTWTRADVGQPPPARRYLERIRDFEPGIELTARPHLDLERDPYLRDHLYQGSYLFPTVFGLEAMAQAVARVTGRQDLGPVRIEDIRLERPIVVNETDGVDIELRATVLEADNGDRMRVRVEVGTEQTGFSVAHFAAEFVLLGYTDPPVEELPFPAEPLDLDPHTDLYGPLLFQGPLFQRLARFYALDSRQCLVEINASEAAASGEGAFTRDEDRALLLGDPFLRDALLQSGQANIPQDESLPIGIDSWEIYPHRLEGTVRATCIVHGREGKEYDASALAVDERGRVLDRLKGYRLRVLSHRPEAPTAEELAAPGERDQRRLTDVLAIAASNLDVELPAMALAQLAGLHDLEQEQRRERERPLLHQVALAAGVKSAEIGWRADGRPELSGAETHTGVSLSHDDQLCLAVAGSGAQGCDLAPVEPRHRSDWIALLGLKRDGLLDQLVTREDVVRETGGNLDRAGTRIWAAIEAATKATGGDVQELTLGVSDGDAVLLETEGGAVWILTVPFKPTRGAERIVAIVVLQAAATALQADGARRTVRPGGADLGYAGKLGKFTVGVESGTDQFVVDTVERLAFKECGYLSRTMSFHTLVRLMGRNREMGLFPIYKHLDQYIVGGTHGLVTNRSNIRVFCPVGVNDQLRTRMWTENKPLYEGAGGEVGYDWRRITPDGREVRAALGRLQFTWVRILGHGMVQPEPMPEPVRLFIEGMMDPARGLYVPEPLEEPLRDPDLGEQLWVAPPGPANDAPLLTMDFETTLEESNLVGNVYFGTYYLLQDRLIDTLLHRVAPELTRGFGENGELHTLEGNIDHLREAMPFDRISGDMSLHRLYRRGAELSFAFWRQEPSGERVKLCHGKRLLGWLIVDGDEGRLGEMPDNLIGAMNR